MQFKFLALATLATLAQQTYATTYAQFCDDTDCSVNCGESVSVDNPGCLGESGRNSVMFHDVNIQSFSLIFSPGATCDCQNDAISDLPESGCVSLAGHASAQSFRFIGGDAGANNC